MLNGKNKYEIDPETGQPTNPKAMNPAIEGLYEKYVNWGLIKTAEARGGWHPYLRAGLTYDSRNMRACPTKGIYADAFFTYTAAFNAKYGQQADAGVPRRGLDDHGIPAKQSLLLGGIDHGFGYPILGRACGVEALQLGKHVGMQTQSLLRTAKLQQRGSADELGCGCIVVRHDDNLISQSES
jgi:hypothetical protein